MVSPCTPLAAQQTGPTDPDKHYYGEEAEALLQGASYVRQETDAAFPTFVKLGPTANVRHDIFVKWLQQEMPGGEHIDLQLIRQEKSASATEHYRYRQVYGGIPIQQAQYLVHVRDGIVRSFNGHIVPVEGEPDIRPAVSEEVALANALRTVGAAKYKWEDPKEEAFIKRHLEDENATYYPEGSLIFAKKEDGTYTLAWQFDIREVNSLLDQRVFIDAQTGEKISSTPITYQCDGGSVPTTWHGTRGISTDEDGDNFILYDDCTGSHDATMRTIDDVTGNDYTDADNDWSEAAVRGSATSHFYLHETHDYFEEVHGRNSYDDSGGNLVIRERDTTSNAFYGGSGIIIIGKGFNDLWSEFYNTLDVVGHEFTHGVIRSTADLVYQGEPGALNESFADIFGECVERRTENDQNIDWLHREDYFNGNNRSFIDPKDKGDPDTYGGDNWAPTCDTCADNGGVHTNSGVQNHWFYLVSEGGTGTNDNGDDYEVIGIGFVKARTIAWENLTVYLGENSDYADARTGAIAAAEDLYGDCSAEVKAVMDAWYAVGVGEPFVTVEAVVSSDYNGSDVSCDGACDGEVTANVDGGTGVYDFEWGANTGNAKTQTVSGLCAGTYEVTVTDTDGCTATSSVTIMQPDPVVASAVGTSDYNGYNVSCAGGSDGVAEASAIGGTGAYSFQWDASTGSQTTAEATGLMAQTYHVTVSDANGCTDSASVTLTEPDSLLIDAGENQTVFFGWPDSACAVLDTSGVMGGVPPYTVEWSTGEATGSIEVCPDTTTIYYVTVTDDNNCTFTDSVKVCVIDVRCGQVLNGIMICHVPPGYPENAQSMCVNFNSVMMHLDEHGDQLAACGTDKSCTFEAPIQALVTPETSGGETDLYIGARPNPFSDRTEMFFRIMEDGPVRLSVHNVVGRQVQMLYEGHAEKGIMYQAALAGSGLSDGIYFYRLLMPDGKIQSGKLVLAR